MWAMLGNVLIALMFLAAISGGVALFVIACQDTSRTGKVLGVLVAIAIGMAVYVVLGQHWL